MNALDWKPRPFTEEELQSISPVIRAYLKDVDVTLLIANRRLSVAQRMLNAQQYAASAAAIHGIARKVQS
ncbi:MAG TPA: hypothetical protein VF595_05035 [Tepidisphaeraceae bacterium]|jgi:hypothetical protein